MKMLKEVCRLLIIMAVSPAIGFGVLVILDAARIATPQYVDKEVFLLIGFTVAIATAIWLLRAWPSEYSSRLPDVPSKPAADDESE